MQKWAILWYLAHQNLNWRLVEVEIWMPTGASFASQVTITQQQADLCMPMPMLQHLFSQAMLHQDADLHGAPSALEIATKQKQADVQCLC